MSKKIRANLRFAAKSALKALKKGQKAKYLILLSLIYTFLFPQYSWAYFTTDQDSILILSYNNSPFIQAIENTETATDLIIIQNNSLISINNPVTPEISGLTCPIPTFTEIIPNQTCPAVKARSVIATAYSSSYDETDSNPFITASGTYVRDGIIAANFLKIGTKVKIPNLYGDKIFTVEDRMAPKNSHKVDIWMPSKSQALQFGVRKAEIVVLEN